MYWAGAGEDDEEGEEGGTSGVCTGEEREDDEEGEEGRTVILFHLHWQYFSDIFCFSDTDVVSATFLLFQ